MCTAISITVKDNYFGRNLDYEHGFGEKVTITPRNFPFVFGNGTKIKSHPAIIGMALEKNNYPLYFDATNEAGLSIAGLNFPGNAYYGNDKARKENIASFELIPWILCQCNTAEEAKELLERTNITCKAFDERLKPTPLHWIVADRRQSVTAEQTENGMWVYENPVGVLTNNPTFDIQLFNLNNYLSVSTEEPQNRFSDKISLNTYSKGMGGLGIPGDLSSMSRFVKATFTKLNTELGEEESQVVHGFFHILYSVYQQKGCVKSKDGQEYTNYTSCCNADKGIYYYTTYNNLSINGVDMHKENLDSESLISYELQKDDNIKSQ